MMPMNRLSSCYSIEDLRRQAKKRLPWGIWEFLEGGSDDEWSVHNNRAAFDHYELIPRSLVDVSATDMSTRVMGLNLHWPVMLSPTGMTRMYHSDGEKAVARAAASADTLYSLATFSSHSIEEVAHVCSGAKMFQLFINPGWERSLELVSRAQDAGYDALCLTVDSAAPPNKERDYRTGIDPGRITIRNLLSILGHPRWVSGILRQGPPRLANLDAGALEAMEIRWRDASRLTWTKVEEIRRLWRGPFALKGILNPEDACRAAQLGVDALILSNHGGRQMDCLPAPVEWVRPMKDAIGDQVDLIVDSGVRRGTDVLKALALGAKACMIGRPYLYGIAAGGEPGVTRAIDILRNEVQRDMKMLGLTSLEDLDERFIRKSPVT